VITGRRSHGGEHAIATNPSALFDLVDDRKTSVRAELMRRTVAMILPELIDIRATSAIRQTRLEGAPDVLGRV